MRSKRKGLQEHGMLGASFPALVLIVLSAVQRLEPLANTCGAAMPELLSLAEKVFKEGFRTNEGSEPKSYTVCPSSSPIWS
jgi:hypothetical protein